MEKKAETPKIKKNITFWSMTLAERKNLISKTIKGFARNGIKVISQLRGYIFWLKVDENNEKIHNLLISAGFKYSESKKEYFIVLSEKGQTLKFEKYEFNVTSYDKYTPTDITAENISLLIV
jgi:hypothetical protein